MKRKGIALGLGILLVLSVTACQSKTPANDNTDSPTTATPTPEASESPVEETLLEVHGTIKSFTGGYLTIVTSDSDNLEFDLSKATLECENGILAGDEITVVYEGTITGHNTSKATALKVIDKDTKEDLEEHTMVGTLVDASMNTISVKNTEGDTITFISTGTKHYYKNGLQVGNWITVTYKGELSRTNTKNVKVLSITDEDENIQEEQEQVAIHAVTKKMYTTANVNVRDAYTVTSDVLGTLSSGDAVELTGETDNGWARINYNGLDAYVYEIYLTATSPAASVPEQAPAVEPQGEEESMTGYVEAVSMSNITVVSQDDGKEYLFDFADAESNLENGLAQAQRIEVTYIGTPSMDTATSTVIKVTNAPLSEEEDAAPDSCSITGTVLATSMNCVTVMSDDGAQITCTTENAKIDDEKGIHIGDYVVITLDPNNDSNVYMALEIKSIY